MKRIFVLSAGFLATSLLLGSAQPLFAGSLSGSAGNERRKIFFPRGAEDCEKGFDKYVAASGHSAYAATPVVWGVPAFICSWATNVRSTSTAEEQALKACNEGVKKYKVRAVPLCEIAASK